MGQSYAGGPGWGTRRAGKLTRVSHERPDGFVFDLDGTLADDMELHAEAFSLFVARHGLPPYTLADRLRFDGQRNRDIFPALFGRALAGGELLRLVDEKEAIYREISRGRLAPVRGAARLLERLRELSLPVAVATSAPAANVAHTLGEIGLGELASRVVRSDDVPRGKPHPDVFLAAARLVGVPPGRCLAFEDAPVGVRAARAAGMACVAVATTFDEAAFAHSGAVPDHVVADFDAWLDGPGSYLLSP